MFQAHISDFHSLYEKLRKKESELWLSYQREDPDGRSQIARKLEAVKEAEHHLIKAIYALKHIDENTHDTVFDES